VNERAEGSLSAALQIYRTAGALTVSQETYDGLPPQIVEAFHLERPDAPGPPPDLRSQQLDVALGAYARAWAQMPEARWGYASHNPSLIKAFTSLFVHAGWMHVLGNLLLLWLTGTVIESFWRRGPFLALYVVGGLWSVLWWDLLGGDGFLVGASGAISVLMGAFMIGHPYTKVRFIYFVWAIIGRPANGTFEAPAWSALVVWLCMQLIGLFWGDGGVAFAAHISGFGFGAAVAWVMKSNGWIRDDDDDIDPDGSTHLVEWTKQIRGQFR
jgi:membrane associated rhomboid family serine protease